MTDHAQRPDPGRYEHLEQFDAVNVDGPRPAMKYAIAASNTWRLGDKEHRLLVALATDSYDGVTARPRWAILAYIAGMSHGRTLDAVKALEHPRDDRPPLIARDHPRGRRPTTFWLLFALADESDAPPNRSALPTSSTDTKPVATPDQLDVTEPVATPDQLDLPNRSGTTTGSTVTQPVGTPDQFSRPNRSGQPVGGTGRGNRYTPYPSLASGPSIDETYVSSDADPASMDGSSEADHGTPLRECPGCGRIIARRAKTWPPDGRCTDCAKRTDPDGADREFGYPPDTPDDPLEPATVLAPPDDLRDIPPPDHPPPDDPWESP